MNADIYHIFYLLLSLKTLEREMITLAHYIHDAVSQT